MQHSRFDGSYQSSTVSITVGNCCRLVLDEGVRISLGFLSMPSMACCCAASNCCWKDLLVAGEKRSWKNESMILDFVITLNVKVVVVVVVMVVVVVVVVEWMILPSKSSVL